MDDEVAARFNAERDLAIQWRAAHDHVHELEQREVQSAFAAAAEKAKTHNDILGAMRNDRGEFVTRAEFKGLENAAAAMVTRTEFAATQKLVYMALGIAVAMPLIVGTLVAIFVNR